MITHIGRSTTRCITVTILSNYPLLKQLNYWMLLTKQLMPVVAWCICLFMAFVMTVWIKVMSKLNEDVTLLQLWLMQRQYSYDNGMNELQCIRLVNHILSVHCITFNSRPSDAYMHHINRPSLVQITTFRLFGTKPWSESMQGYCELGPWQQVSIEVKSLWNKKNTTVFPIRKIIWKYRPQNGGQFVSGKYFVGASIL